MSCVHLGVVDESPLCSLTIPTVPKEIIVYRPNFVSSLTAFLPHEDRNKKIPGTENLITDSSNQMNVLVGDVDEAGAGFVEEFASEEEAVAEISEVGVDAEFPGVAEGADHFWFLGEVFVLAVFDVAMVDAGLEMGAVTDTVRRVDVHHLDLAGHAFFFKKGVHDQERVAGDEAIGPSVRVAIEIDGLAERRIFFASFKEVALRGP